MAKVITFSRYFPSYHPRAGEPTRFVEKIYASLADNLKGFKIPNDANEYWDWYEYYNCRDPKNHTIRAGHQWKAGDWFKPVVWGDDINPKSGRKGSYHSKQIQFAPEIQIKKVWDFGIAKVNDGMLTSYKMFINNKITRHGNAIMKNDGLTYNDFCAWFKMDNAKKTIIFDGQIICWNENINYV